MDEDLRQHRSAMKLMGACAPTGNMSAYVRGYALDLAYLDFEGFIAAEAEVVHFVVSVVGVPAVLVFDKGETAESVSKPTAEKLRYSQPARSGARCRNITADKATITLEFICQITSAGAMAEASDIQGSSTTARHDLELGKWSIGEQCSMARS